MLLKVQVRHGCQNQTSNAFPIDRQERTCLQTREGLCACKWQMRCQPLQYRHVRSHADGVDLQKYQNTYLVLCRFCNP